jgi:DNA-binding response OmpR family regulator
MQAEQIGRQEVRMRVLLIPGNLLDVQTSLVAAGYVVETARDADAADTNLRSAPCDIVIYDIDGPQADVLGRVQRWRRRGIKSHLVVLASQLTLQTRVNLLDAGADCYVLKPNHLPELLARLRVLTRRGEQVKDSVLRVFDLEIDLERHMVKRAGHSIPLTPREYSLLRYLALHRGRIVRRSMILENLYDGRDESNVVNVYIRYLRNKIDTGFEVPLILTRYGQGYMLRGEIEQDAGTAPFSLAVG